MELKKKLGFLDVFSIASGAMISSGIFILPGIAFNRAGPSVFLSYLVAGAIAFVGILSVTELATAMPKAGGDYFFITRSLGAGTGTVSGLLSWAALSLKAAFAIFGLTEIIYLLIGGTLSPLIISGIILAVFLLLNILGVDIASRFQVVLVLALIVLMLLYSFYGASKIDLKRYTDFFPNGAGKMFTTAGFVFVSFGGLVKVASMAEEIHRPKRNLPRGLIASILTVTFLYGFILFITLGIIPAEELRSSFTPIADAAFNILGLPGRIIINLAAALAFITTINAGIMAASRYPLALGRDRLIPGFLSVVLRRFKTPIVSILLTGALIYGSLLLELETLVKAASAVIIGAYLLSNLSVIILRASKIHNYRPSFRAPLFPYLQIVSICLFIWLLSDLGWDALKITLIFGGVSIIIYFAYGRRRAKKESALMHLIKGAAARELGVSGLEEELKEIIRSRDEIVQDPFDRLIRDAPILDIKERLTRDSLFSLIAAEVAPGVGLSENAFLQLLKDREKESSTALTPFVAIPHVVLAVPGVFRLMVIRCAEGIEFSPERSGIQAVFVLAGSREERTFHLQALAAIAQIIQNESFREDWLKARTIDNLRDLLLLGKRHRYND
ncbi:MAG: amino acid permease [Spirochaetales bacterium]|nr:MAG: amino acid permease [Spirochaetales bacterium]